MPFLALHQSLQKLPEQRFNESTPPPSGSVLKMNQGFTCVWNGYKRLVNVWSVP